MDNKKPRFTVRKQVYKQSDLVCYLTDNQTGMKFFKFASTLDALDKWAEESKEILRKGKATDTERFND